MWLADFAIIISFGSVGAAYLGGVQPREKTRWVSFAILTLATAYLWRQEVNLILLLFLILAGFMIWWKFRVGREVIADCFIAFILLTSISMRIIIKPWVAMLTGFFGIPAILIIGLLTHAHDIVIGTSNMPGVTPAIPAEKEGKWVITFPGVGISLPLNYALIALGITVIFHEFAHGIISRVHKMKLKSTGIITLGALPIGAFVEPDEEVLNKSPGFQKMRVFAIGSFSNLIVAGFTFLILTYGVGGILEHITEVDGVEVIGLDQGYPAEKYLQKNQIIYKLNGVEIRSLQNFSYAASKLKPGQEVVLETDHGIIKFNTTTNPANKSRAYMGVVVAPHFRLKKGIDAYKCTFNFLTSLSIAMYWIIFFNFNIALVNLLPLVPLDGGKMFEELIAWFKLSELNTKRVVYGVIAFMVMLLFLNAYPLFTLVWQEILRFLS